MTDDQLALCASLRNEVKPLNPNLYQPRDPTSRIKEMQRAGSKLNVTRRKVSDTARSWDPPRVGWAALLRVSASSGLGQGQQGAVPE